MAVKNIEMNYRNESGYDVLYPESILENIVDWQNSIYSKSEIDNLVQQIQNSLDSFVNQTGNLKVEIGSYSGQYGLSWQNTTSSAWTTIALSFTPKCILIGTRERGFLLDFYDQATDHKMGAYGLITTNGLYMYAQSANVLVGQIINNGFQVRNGVGRYNSSSSNQVGLTILGFNYQYIAFG